MIYGEYFVFAGLSFLSEFLKSFVSTHLKGYLSRCSLQNGDVIWTMKFLSNVLLLVLGLGLYHYAATGVIGIPEGLLENLKISDDLLEVPIVVEEEQQPENINEDVIEELPQQSEDVVIGNRAAGKYFLLTTPNNYIR